MAYKRWSDSTIPTTYFFYDNPTTDVRPNKSAIQYTDPKQLKRLDELYARDYDQLKKDLLFRSKNDKSKTGTLEKP